jgi:opacity protein-like surface antigen
LTAGAGWGSTEISSGGLSEDGQGFQYNVGAGVGYALNEHVTLDGRVRYEDGERDFGSFGDLDRDATVATIGVRLS